MDNLDKAILNELRYDSRKSLTTIGKKVHLTGQAVGVRIKNLEECGLIQGYTLKESFSDTQFITVYMNSNNYELFENFIKYSNGINEFYKISGDGCYFITTNFSKQEIEPFLKKLTKYARYKINTSIIQLI